MSSTSWFDKAMPKFDSFAAFDKTRLKFEPKPTRPEENVILFLRKCINLWLIAFNFQIEILPICVVALQKNGKQQLIVSKNEENVNQQKL